MDEHSLALDRETARRLLLVQAIDEADVQGRLVSAAEREQVEQDALAESRKHAKDARWDAGTFLRERAKRILALVEGRQPSVASQMEEHPWRDWLAWGLPLAACVLGAAIDRIDNPQKVNMLSPPLLAVVLWNLLVYTMLLVTPWLPKPWADRMPWTRLQQRFAGWRGRPGRAGSVRADVAMRFNSSWLAVTGEQQRAWAGLVLHASAAAWAIGLAISIVLGGLVREYRVGWESTLLELPQVHALLSLLFAPVVALLPFEPFSMAELQRMHFSTQAAVGVQEARHWIWMYLSLLGLLVALPRAVLAAIAVWRMSGARGGVRVDLSQPYFADMLARVAPARVVIGVPAGSDVLLRVLRDAESVQTAREDELRVVELRDGEPAEKADVVLKLSPEEMDRATRTWMHEDELRQSISERLPKAKAGGFARIANRWAERDQMRFADAMRVLAAQLLRDARDTEDMHGMPLSLKSLVSREQREANQRAQQQAVEAIVARLHAAEGEALGKLLRLHGVTGADGPAFAPSNSGEQFPVQQAVDTPQAGMAGAATGAAMGAGIDMITGGMTLGAATALGALVGGAFGYTAAHFRNRSAPSGVAQIQLTDEMLQAEVEHALLRYLAVIHWGRGMHADDATPAAWRSEVVATVEADREQWAAIWARARDNQPDDHELQLQAAALLEATARRLVVRL